MPGVAGPAAVTQLKGDPATRRIPVVAMTAVSGPEVQKLMDAGCLGYIPKPFEVRSFSALVDGFVRATATRRPGLWPR